MRYLPTGGWMKKADRETICNIGIPSMVLMERAALKAVEAMEAEGFDLGRAIVFCGPGNNGGDGFAVARLLREKGYEASALFVGEGSHISPECSAQMNIAQKCGVPVVTSIEPGEYTAIIDAVFGVGLDREITGGYLETIRLMNSLEGRKAAIDIPSGVSSFTGEILGEAFRAELTATFACEKLGMAMYPGKLYAGKTVICDIGISKDIFKGEPDVCYTFDRGDIAALMPKRVPDSHKGTYGRVLMITGSKGMSGAAYLSAKAAYICGAGLVQIYTPEENRIILQQLLPEAIISTYNGFECDKLKELLKKADVACIGCGLGTGRIQERILETVLEEADIPLVIDADGLNILKDRLGLLGGRKSGIVLTPHMKEMSRLLRCSVNELASDRFGRLRAFTEENGVVCVLKDARTVVAEFGKPFFVNTAGNSSMAKAGSGDVLSGVITGLMAQKKDPYDAATLGVYIHACGGDKAKARKGAYSVLADDLIDGIASCIRKSEENR